MYNRNKPEELLSIFATLLFFLLFISFIVYSCYRMVVSDQKIFTISMIALFGGVLFESIRISDKWQTIVIIFLCCFIISFIFMLPGKNENHYTLESHLHNWPYIFIFMFIIVTSLFLYSNVFVFLDEGITLLLSLSVIYWIIDFGFWNFEQLWIKILIVIAFIFSAFSIFNALTYFILTPAYRHILSVWSSIVLLLFAIDNIMSVFSNGLPETTSIEQGILVALQYFLLGISTIYIIQNIVMLSKIIPKKYYPPYKFQTKKSNQSHIGRYSERQVNAIHAFICILLVTPVYYVNYTFHFLPRNVLIWLVILLFPIFIRLISFQKRSKRYDLK